MSVLALVVPIFIAVMAALIRAAILGAWTVRGLVADFAFALCILLLPLVIRP